MYTFHNNTKYNTCKIKKYLILKYKNTDIHIMYTHVLTCRNF